MKITYTVYCICKAVQQLILGDALFSSEPNLNLKLSWKVIRDLDIINIVTAWVFCVQHHLIIHSWYKMMDNYRFSPEIGFIPEVFIKTLLGQVIYGT